MNIYERAQGRFNPVRRVETWRAVVESTVVEAEELDLVACGSGAADCVDKMSTREGG